MSWSEVSRVAGVGIKSATFWSAAKWRAEAERRRDIRITTGPRVVEAVQVRNALRRLDAKSPATAKAQGKVNAARRNHPDSMLWLSTKVAGGIVAAGWFGLPLVPGAVWAWSAVVLAVLAVGAVAWAVKRSPKESKGLEPSKEEAQLLKRLDPKHWTEHAEGRGLAGTVTGKPQLGDGGITCAVRLDGKWTPAAFKGALDNVRSLLGARSGLRIEAKSGDRGGWAKLVLRTRSAADGDDLTWTPANRSFGVDTVTGELVTVPLGERLLIAGMSGAGKSVSSRPLLYDASEGDTNALVIIDLKRVEGRLWDHRARVASTPDEVVAVVAELVAEMQHRLDVLPKGEDKWTPTADRPRLTVVVDEGAEVVTAAKQALEGLETLARMGRAAAMDLWWMTQKPTLGDGIPRQIAPQMGARICLAVSTPTEARVVLGEDAQAKGWHADSLDTPGFAMFRYGKRGPNPIQVRYMDKKVVIGLPAQPIWHGSQQTPQTPAEVPQPRDEATPDAKVISILREIGPAKQKDVVERSGLLQGSVSKVLKRLVDAGSVTRDGAGQYEVSA